jgi:hypothetical protein
MTELTPRERFALSAPPPPGDWYDYHPDPPGKPDRPDCFDVHRHMTKSEERQVKDYVLSMRRWRMKQTAEAAAAWAWAYADAALEARG